MKTMLGRTRPRFEAVASPLGSDLSRVRVWRHPARLGLHGRRSLISCTETRNVARSWSELPWMVQGNIRRSLTSTFRDRSTARWLGLSVARSLSSSPGSASEASTTTAAANPDAAPSLKDGKVEGEQQDSIVWTLVFTALVVGAIGFTVWQEVDGHGTQSAQRERNRRRAEERERRDAEAAEQQQLLQDERQQSQPQRHGS